MRILGAMQFLEAIFLLYVLTFLVGNDFKQLFLLIQPILAIAEMKVKSQKQELTNY